MQRFNVYRNNVFVSLTDLLQAYFPVVTRLVGEQFFRTMARAFIAASPPRSPILSRYGARFAVFVEKFLPAQDLPYLADVARLEWLQQRAYHAADRDSLTARDLAEIPIERASDLTFDFHPSVGVFASRFPAVSIWRTNTFDAEVRLITLDDGDEAALVVRPRLKVGVVPLPCGAERFVALLMKGHTVGEATATMLRANRDFNLQTSLALLIEAGAFVCFDAREKYRDDRHGKARHDRPPRLVN